MPIAIEVQCLPYQARIQGCKVRGHGGGLRHKAATPIAEVNPAAGLGHKIVQPVAVEVAHHQRGGVAIDIWDGHTGRVAIGIGGG